MVKSSFDDRTCVIVMDRDAKIAALVQNSADTDKMLADARLEKLAYLKELHNANERCAQLEAKYERLNNDRFVLICLRVYTSSYAIGLGCISYYSYFSYIKKFTTFNEFVYKLQN